MENVAGRFEHDEAVIWYALHLLSAGYDVRARIEGWFQEPEYINGYRPDIIAQKGNEWLIVEIKKSDTDWPKINALERVQTERPNYRLVIASPREVLSQPWMNANAG